MSARGRATPLLLAMLLVHACGNADRLPLTDAGADAAQDVAIRDQAPPVDGKADAVPAADTAEARDSTPTDLGDAAPDGADQPCPSRGEQACTQAAGCFVIRAVPLADFCNGLPDSAVFAGCEGGGRDGGAALTWGRQEGSGQIARFATTQLPAGWTPIPSPECPQDAGLD
jgi:hypothetical protein